MKTALLEPALNSAKSQRPAQALRRAASLLLLALITSTLAGCLTATPISGKMLDKYPDSFHRDETYVFNGYYALQSSDSGAPRLHCSAQPFKSALNGERAMPPPLHYRITGFEYENNIESGPSICAVWAVILDGSLQGKKFRVSSSPGLSQRFIDRSNGRIVLGYYGPRKDAVHEGARQTSRSGGL